MSNLIKFTSKGKLTRRSRDELVAELVNWIGDGSDPFAHAVADGLMTALTKSENVSDLKALIADHDKRFDVLDTDDEAAIDKVYGESGNFLHSLFNKHLQIDWDRRCVNGFEYGGSWPKQRQT